MPSIYGASMARGPQEEPSLEAADLDSAFVKLTIYLNLGIARLSSPSNARKD